MGNRIRPVPVREKENEAEAEVRFKSAPNRQHHVILYNFALSFRYSQS
jgi:hypothetical protein